MGVILPNIITGMRNKSNARRCEAALLHEHLHLWRREGLRVLNPHTIVSCMKGLPRCLWASGFSTLMFSCSRQGQSTTSIDGADFLTLGRHRYASLKSSIGAGEPASEDADVTVPVTGR